jgi:HSP20 family molecular chaperone IbpA
VANELELSKKYTLARSAVEMADFTVAELVFLTGAAPKTVSHFIHELSNRELVKRASLPANGRGRPRKSYQLTHGGRKHLLNYMQMVRLKLDEEPVPSTFAPSTAVPVSSGYPQISISDVGSRCYVQAAVPGLGAKDVEVVSGEQGITLRGNYPKLRLGLGLSAGQAEPAKGFSCDIDLPPGFRVIKHTVRNGIVTIEIKKRASVPVSQSTPPVFANPYVEIPIAAFLKK